MTVTPASIQQFVYNVTFDGVDLGGTTGPISVTPGVAVGQTKVANYGDAPVGAKFTGHSISVTAPLTERAVSQLLKLYHGSTLVTDGSDPTVQKVTMGKLVGEDVNTGLLVLHPQHLAAGTKTYDITVYKAFVNNPGDLSFAADAQTGMNVEFVGMHDTARDDGDTLHCFGDPDAAA